MAGVLVGHVTVNRGEGPDAARTGVTAVLPHGGDLWNEKVPAATWVLNGNGEMTGGIWLNTQGALDVPILLTNTMNVPRVADGVITYMLKKYPEIGRSDDVAIPVVGECDDSTLNDARGRHVTPDDAVQAIAAAKSGPVAEGSVGAGTGMIAYAFKGRHRGTTSRACCPAGRRRLDGRRARQARTWAAAARNLTMANAPVGKEIPASCRSRPRTAPSSS